ncbi:MAG: SpoIID/LytB domain-containing protein [Caldicoprobacterales bacterium]
MNKKTSYIKIMCVLVIMALVVGCTALTRRDRDSVPEKETREGRPLGTKRPSTQKDPGDSTRQQASKKPSLPKALEASEGQEPSLKVFINEENRVEEMKLEDYIKNVVAGEIKNDWPDEAIKAQAIIARTFVLNFIDEKGQSKYDKAHVSTDVEEAQAWNPEAVNEKIQKAVQDTRGLVMVYDGKFAQGWFHSNAAGKTATAKEGLNYKKENPPYIKMVDSPDDSTEIPDDEASWEYRASKAKVLEALKSMGKSLKDINSVSIGQKGESGRAVTLSFDGTEVSAPDFRIAIGSTEMKSTLLDAVELQGDQVVFKGRGYGHGVGMSQWGAYKMAKEGKKAGDIIAHYFQGVTIEKMWD